MRAVMLAAILVACSAPSGAPPAYCAADPRVESFTLGMKTVGATGASFSITSANPSVVQQGLNDWTVAVHDTSGAPVDGTLTMLPFMPDHGHGSPTNAVITSKGGGVYDVSGINLSMRGVWQITLTIASPAVNDSAVFTFCVDGAS